MSISAPDFTIRPSSSSAPITRSSEDRMRKSGSSRERVVRKRGQLSAVCAGRVVEFLRQAHPTKTAESVEAAAGIAVCTVRKWLDRSSAPSFVHSLALIAAYGPGFLAAVMDRPPEWIDAAARAARREELKREIAALEAEVARQALGEDCSKGVET
jgi:hypothetical protein